MSQNYNYPSSSGQQGAHQGSSTSTNNSQSYLVASALAGASLGGNSSRGYETYQYTSTGNGSSTGLGGAVSSLISGSISYNLSNDYLLI